MEALLLNKKIRATQQRFKSDHHTITTEEINKIALSRKDDKRIQSYDWITTYPYGTSAFKVCRSEMEITIKNRPKLKESLLKCDKEKYNELNNIPIALYY